MSSISRRVAVSRCTPAGRDDGRAGQRDVDDVGGQLRVELGGVELGRARLDRGLERLARLVGGAADRRALLRGELGDAAQQVRQLRLAAEEAHPHVLELGRVRRLGDRRLAGRAQLADPLVHGAAILRLHSYRATVAAIAAFSDSAATGIVAVASHASMTLRGRPSRSAPTTSVTSPSTAASGSPPWATSAIRAARAARSARARARSGPRTARPSPRARPCARTGRRCRARAPRWPRRTPARCAARCRRCRGR